MTSRFSVDYPKRGFHTRFDNLIKSKLNELKLSKKIIINIIIGLNFHWAMLQTETIVFVAQPPCKPDN